MFSEPVPTDTSKDKPQQETEVVTAQTVVEVESTPEVEQPPAEPATMNGDIKEDVQVNGDAGTGKGKKGKNEKPEVSSDLLAEINKPIEEPKAKASIDTQLKKNKLGSTPLTGRAAERERERLKREEERELRAAQRAKEREEAAKKRKEQKEAFEKKMSEQRKQREVKSRGISATSNTRASRNAFKEKLEANAPARSESPANNLQNPTTNLSKLLGWCRKRTRDYEGVNVENFSESWSDGLAFAALMHSFLPDRIPIEELNAESRRKNFEIAFAVARDEGVMDLLDVDDMVAMRSPDPKSIMTYVHSVYQTFNETEAAS